MPPCAHPGWVVCLAVKDNTRGIGLWPMFMASFVNVRNDDFQDDAAYHNA
jgi:hypothetical protein